MLDRLVSILYSFPVFPQPPLLAVGSFSRNQTRSLFYFLLYFLLLSLLLASGHIDPFALLGLDAFKLAPSMFTTELGLN